jgi:hypothetical protein
VLVQIFDCASLIAWASKDMTLAPGTVRTKPWPATLAQTLQAGQGFEHKYLLMA